MGHLIIGNEGGPNELFHCYVGKIQNWLFADNSLSLLVYVKEEKKIQIYPTGL